MYILIAFLHFFFNFQEKDPAGSVKHQINLVWPRYSEKLSLELVHTGFLGDSPGGEGG